MSEQKSIAQVIELAGERFNQIAPPHMKYEAEKGFAIQILKNNDYLMSIAQACPSSLQQAITNVAAIGLSLNPAEKQAYLISRTIKTKDANGKDRYEKRIFLEPSYVGLCKLATDSGSIEWVHAAAVYDADEFMDSGPGEKPTHKYQAFKPRGQMVGVYCTAKTKGGDYLTTMMDMQKILSIRDRSEAWKAKMDGKVKTGGPWETDFEEMAKKSVVRQAFKMWPRTDERRMAMLAQAVELSNQNEGFEPILTSPTIKENTMEQKEYFDQLIEKNDAIGMFVFVKSLRDNNQDNVVTNLYHSFEKGQKGKYQRIVDTLLSAGESQFRDYLDNMRAAIHADDQPGFQQLAEELSPDAMKLVESMLTVQEKSTYKRWAA